MPLVMPFRAENNEKLARSNGRKPKSDNGKRICALTSDAKILLYKPLHKTQTNKLKPCIIRQRDGDARFSKFNLNVILN
ncbi:hypothetical protein PRLR5107_09440 [Prevotella lacticifex]|uniref:Uncharacterized protein n=1 Tax=Prevotella lacticifex TaxID=2854755 RepID=A0A9R1C9F6_9BACT|nr:hypothetical protein PRLR5003_03850 [Prevotella lacticifex]GJG39721.1 hypothetical protein PRLR5019_16920 [Prevotella lacticifex]GJG41597.1 hypothetical protein PRLR5025_03830 [Prevotella lacticifex]GJG46077.1 hypothetical protein PRLR5027_16720 [Prevotella lacticifex]GJG47948.1 hypothetical protein PRLR5052_03610 [Prevotella lacticifex]